MRERADRLYRLDETPGDHADRPGRPDSAAATTYSAIDQGRVTSDPEAATEVRDALRRRLTDLPSWHPSSARSDNPGPRADRPDEHTERQGSDLPPDQEDDVPADSFWAQIPRLDAAWESHLTRWPDKPDSPARTADKHDPPGSWRGRGDHVLSPEQNAETDQLIADLAGQSQRSPSSSRRSSEKTHTAAC